jgi:cyclic pyranopterin phosphate synthase
MLDSRGRTIEYLRLSLTERCNLRCIYCRDEAPPNTGQEISAREIGRILSCMVSLGINKVRLTGGEPLLRADLEELIGKISATAQIRDLCMTSNALGFARRAKALRQAGLMRMNISLDSLKPDRYREIARGGDLEEVLEAIDAAIAVGLTPLKLNCVPIRGKNDDEIDAFIDLARNKPLHVRFIELMPMGEDGLDWSLRITTKDILDAHPELQPLPPSYAGQPAEDYAAPGFRGTVGFISPISHLFCNDCNRVRVTSDGKLRPCLGDNTEVDLRGALGKGDEELLRVIRETVYHKPEGHHFNEGFVSKRRMFRIGG